MRLRLCLRFRRSLRPPLAVSALLVVAAVRCATAPGPPRDSFPLDPREGLAGPFDESVAEGWRALLAGDTSGAERELHRAESSR